MKSVWIMICLAVGLAGCAVRSDVRASLSSTTAFADEPRSYVLSRAPYPAVDDILTEYESAVAASLRQHGFVAANANEARYRVSLSYETHSQSIAAGRGACPTGSASIDCGNAGNQDGESGKGPALLSWPWQHAFVHSLTLRFFDRASGRELYKVSSTSRDHESSPREALPYLVESALARLPYPADGNWRVKMPRGENGRSATISKIR